MWRWIAAALVLVAVLPVATSGDLRAQQMEVMRLAILDVDRVRNQAAAVRDIRGQMEGYMESYRSETEKEEAGIRTAQEELGRKRTILSPEAYAEERRKLEQRLVEAQGRVQQRRRSLEKVHGEAMNRVQEVLNKIVTEIAAEQSLTLILRKDQAVFVNTNLEITDEVLRRLDSQLPKVRISNPGN
jgi:Skp family chaperone for outer membrane proteins